MKKILLIIALLTFTFMSIPAGYAAISQQQQDENVYNIARELGYTIKNHSRCNLKKKVNESLNMIFRYGGVLINQGENKVDRLEIFLQGFIDGINSAKFFKIDCEEWKKKVN